MTWTQYAIICAANQLKPGEEGYEAAKEWKQAVVRSILKPPPIDIEKARLKLGIDIRP